MSQTETTSSQLAESVAGGNNSTQYVGFLVDKQEYAFPIQQIQEIVMPGKVTRTPQVASYVEGVSNLRGTIIPMINLRQLFGLEAKPTDEETRTIVVNVGERTMGCTVDSVAQVIRVSAEQIQPAPELVTGAGNAYIAGFAKLGERLLVLLNIDELLEPDKLEAVHQAALQGEIVTGE